MRDENGGEESVVMALWIEMIDVDGDKGRIPVMNREQIDFESYPSISKLRVVDEVVTNHDSLAERRYNGNDIRRVIKAVQPGDVLHVSSYPESYKDVKVFVSKQLGDQVEAETDDGTGYFLFPSYWGPGDRCDGMPWLRTADGFESRGEIEEIEILHMADD